MVKRKRSINRNSSRDKESLSTLVKCRKSNSSVLAKSCNINPKSALCLYSNENCEFCDSSFNSKLEVLIHNATHIIIPLIRFTSKNDLDNLTTTKYLRKKERSDVSDRKKSNMIVIGNVKQQCEEINEVICISDESDLETPLSNVDLEDFIPSARVTKLASKSINDVLGSLVADCKVNLGEPMVLSDNENVDSNNLLTSFTNDCKVNLGHHLRFEESPNDTRILLNDEEKLLLPRSVHYDELKKPSLHTCHLCRQKFHNEYNFIRHKAEHVRVHLLFLSEIIRNNLNTCEKCKRFFTKFEASMEHHRRYHWKEYLSRRYCVYCRKGYYSFTHHIILNHMDENTLCIKCKAPTVHITGLCNTCLNSRCVSSKIMQPCSTCFETNPEFADCQIIGSYAPWDPKQMKCCMFCKRICQRILLVQPISNVKFHRNHQFAHLPGPDVPNPVGLNNGLIEQTNSSFVLYPMNETPMKYPDIPTKPEVEEPECVLGF